MTAAALLLLVLGYLGFGVFGWALAGALLLAVRVASQPSPSKPA